ncbi:hypothetical protein KIL84_004927 [Mauremys mutica]|uniref:C-type lectin domain-containing protein n=1 Tax=Mauremys mutica TaxID=74926 RepID=A0A9D4B7P1_9SAUR|nr:hypothetical protein KIL84_004927 [Mauremys mutica]
MRQDIIWWQLPMALSTCSGRDEGYKMVVRDRFEAGMRELVCFTQHLLEAEADPNAHEKIRERIEAASREMSAADDELGRQLKTVDSRTEELVVKKKSLQDEQEEKKENLKRLRIQLDSCRRSEREAREMLERANRQLGEMQAELQRQREEAERNRLTRDIGIGLMFIPFLGTIAVGRFNSLLAAKGPYCPDGWVGFLGKCYYFSETEGNWTYSQKNCSALGASLAVTDTFRDLVFMLRHKGLFEHWIGLRRDQEGQPWKWPNGTEFNNLFEIQGEGDCVYLNNNYARIVGCGLEKHWICSKRDGYTARKQNAL